MIAGGFCNGNPNHPDCYQLRLDSTMFYDFESGQIFKNIQKINFLCRHAANLTIIHNFDVNNNPYCLCAP